MPKARYVRGKDGYFSTKRWDGTYTDAGKRHMVNLRTKQSSAALERIVQEFEEQIKTQGVILPSSLDFFDYAQHWVQIYKASREKATIEMYENVIKKHFQCFKGIMPADLQRYQIQELINNNAKHPRLCQKIMLSFNQVVKSAVVDQLIGEKDAKQITADITLPQYFPKERRVMYQKEVSALSKAKFTTEQRAFVYILYGCGLRREEVLALTPFNFKLAEGILYVREAVGYYHGAPYIKVPKSRAGGRSVPIPGYVKTAVIEYMSERSGDSPYLFCMKTGLSDKSPKGGLLTADCYKVFWDKIREQINYAMGGTKQISLCPDLTAHIFRHTYCTNLCYQIPKISPKKIAQLMGDTEKMVNEVYSHIVENKENTEDAISLATAL